MKTVCYLAHCLLNANAKVDAGARCEGVSAPVVALLREHHCTIRQMPCPELAFGVLRRFWAVREQYDTPVPRALPAARDADRAADPRRPRGGSARRHPRASTAARPWASS